MIAVIGCGNPNRSDDGAGSAVVQALVARGLDRAAQSVRLLDAGTDGMAVMFAARGCRTLIIVDACRSGSLPGAIFEVPGAELEQRQSSSFTTHDFRWDHALFAGRSIFRDDFPIDVTVLLIEAATVDFGIGLSEAVSTGTAKVVDRIEALVRSRLETMASSRLKVARGSLYMSRDTYDRHFPGLETVILLRRDDDLAVLPVQQAAAGGYLLKRRNANGDRVVNAADFFRSQGIEDDAELDLTADWSTSIAGLLANGAFAVTRAPQS